jgi:hypothetical protein
MKTKLLLFFAFCLMTFSVVANNDKYRLILVDDPATTITVAWNQISGLNSTLYYDTIDHGTNTSAYAFSQTEDRAIVYRGMDNRFVRLTNLSPNTNYYFVVSDSQGVSQRYWFKTSTDDNSPLSFIAGGDSRNNRIPRQNANKLVSKLKPNAVLFGGDMTDDDTDQEWQDWFDDWQLTTALDGRMFPIVPARGNHENPIVIYNLFDTPNTESYYALTFGNDLLRTYTLNSEISVLGNQLTWLQNDLANSNGLTWKMAQYHKPMRPHTSGKSEGNNEYGAWAQLFFDEEVRLVVDCDSHMAKTTWPIKPSSSSGNDEGFVVDQLNGTVYTGEGCWGAPLRPNNDDKSWTRSSGSFNQFKLIFVYPNEIKLRTIIVNNADQVGEVANNDPFTLPLNLDVFTPPTGAVVIISNSIDNNCNAVGTPCDDNDPLTIIDEEDGLCNCEGVLAEDLVQETILVGNSSDDAEENIGTGSVNISNTELEFIYDSTDQIVGVRFENIQIPSGSAIHRAYIQFETGSTAAGQDPTNLMIHGELIGTSASFSTQLNDVSSRNLTQNTVLWSEIDTWDTIDEAGIYQRTPYLNTIVNEIISQAVWTSGNSISFMFSGQGKRVAKSFDSGNPPTLKLFYQEPCPEAGTSCDDGDPLTVLDVEDGNCNCIGLQESGNLTYQVTGTTDDAEESETGGVMYTTSSDLELVFDAFAGQNNQTIGIRFGSVGLPENASVLDARIQFTTDETGSDPTNLLIKGELSSNSTAFSESVLFDITGRPQTFTAVQWQNIPSWNTVGDVTDDQKTPNLRAIVQEIIEQSTWSIFNPITFIIQGEGKRTAESFDGSSNDAPRLIITYTLNNTCPKEGTPCDDNDVITVNDEEDGFCNCIGLATLNLTESDIVVNNSSDDAEEVLSTGVLDITSSDLELIWDGEDQVVGVRYNNVNLPDQAFLYRAYIQFQTDEDDSDQDPTNLIINGELADDSATFINTNSNISSRVATNSQVDWDTISLWDLVGEEGINQRTPYLTNIINEIRGQNGWIPGNAMTFIFSGSGKRVAESKDGNAVGPVLKLFYRFSDPCLAFGTTCDDGDASTLFDIEDGNCNCAGITETGTLIYDVTNSANDAEEELSSGAISLTSTDLELTFESGSTEQLVGLRFTDIHLPANATITSAYVQFTVDDDNNGATNLSIAAEANANSLEFTDTAFDISSRTLLSNTIPWSNIPAWVIEGDATLDQRTPDIKTLVEGVLQEPNWQLLNPIAFVFSGTGEREADSFEGNNAPQLIINYDLATLSTERFEKIEIMVYPNPTHHLVHMESKINMEHISIYNMLGKMVINHKAMDTNVTLDISNLSNGIYFIKIKQVDKDQEQSYKLIVD